MMSRLLRFFLHYRRPIDPKVDVRQVLKVQGEGSITCLLIIAALLVGHLSLTGAVVLWVLAAASIPLIRLLK